MEIRQKTLAIYLLLFIAVISIASATSLKPHKVNTDLEIYQECFNCTYCNFSTFKSPTGASLLTGMEATQEGTHWYYNIGEGNITEQGTYTYCYSCGNLVEAETGCIDVPVNYRGEDFNAVSVTIYIVVLLFLIGLTLFLLLYLYPRLPKHARDDENYVTNVTHLAYMRPAMLGVVWILILSITFIIANLSIAYITAGFLGNFIFGIWKLMFMANYLILPLWVIAIIHNIYRTNQIKEFIDRGGVYR